MKLSVVEKNTADISPAGTGLAAFLGWLKACGYEGYDAYDLWATDYGIAARRLFYKNKLLGMPFVAPVALADIFFSGVRQFFTTKKRYATSDAHFILGFLNLYEATGEKSYLAEAEALAVSLLSLSIPGYSGHCWGYPFDWQNNRGLWKKGTPFITVTPYAFEAFLALYDATGKKEYLETALSSARFALNDLRVTWQEGGAAASSYSPLDDTRIVNANAYRAFVLIEAYARSGNEEYQIAAERNIAFILKAQKPDGSWLYAEGNPKDAFIDHFHTCFVLKNLYKANHHLKSMEIDQALARGAAFYHEALFDTDGMPKPYASGKKAGIVTLEMYDMAEAISLGVLMRYRFPGHYEKSLKLARKLNDYQHEKGFFATRVYSWGPQYRPYIRWPQAQLFYALTQVTKTEAEKK